MCRDRRTSTCSSMHPQITGPGKFGVRPGSWDTLASGDPALGLVDCLREVRVRLGPLKPPIVLSKRLNLTLRGPREDYAADGLPERCAR